MTILFMGTPDFAVPTLQALLDSSHEVIGVVTQPDKPKGRSKKLQYSPVKEAALAAGVPIYQPQRVKDEAFLCELRKMQPDAIVVVAFGQILSKEILELPQYGCFNVHASLLPKKRGAAPIQWSVIDGDEYSGVTIMQMDEGLDTGDILLTEKYRLSPKETGGSLFDRLAALGGPMILQVLSDAENGTLQPVPQNESEHTYAKMLSKAAGQIDFSKPAVEIERLIRGLNPWPSAYCYLDGKLLKLWAADVVTAQETEGSSLSGEAGTIVAVRDDAFLILTGQDYLSVREVQLEGKKRMRTADFLRGYALEPGMLLTGQNSAEMG